jgi:hypothetical protein
LSLFHLRDGETLPLVAGRYQIVSFDRLYPGNGAPPPSGEQLYAALSAESFESAPRPGDTAPSFDGCWEYPIALGDGGTVSIAIQGDTISGSIDGWVGAPPGANPDYPHYDGAWVGTFVAGVCK